MLILSIGAIAFVYFAEYFLGFEPCLLCYYQRYVVFTILAIAAIGIRFPSDILYLFEALAILAYLGLTSYHLGIEKQIFPELAGCALYGNVSCSKPVYLIGDLSFAGASFYFSLLLLLLTLNKLPGKK